VYEPVPPEATTVTVLELFGAIGLGDTLQLRESDEVGIVSIP
jgi:hypothetical protein